MQVSRRVRAGGTLGRLLLVAVLALGVLAMHSTGHPSESAHAMSTVSHSTAATDTARSTDATRSTDAADPAAPADAHTTGSGPRSSHKPAPTMDMQSLCVAILLGAWVLTALLAPAFTRRHEERAELLARVAAFARPRPPPRGPDLTRLSVLRL
ncbi:DUF6153 family protein [Streptomyces caniscabiei]|uniref:Uncharacterized protein n=1 Tax=Streptomyces caniscabiei TaxID=2746961 RepID=A0A927LAD3_9ACTN|nr:DUF6153 family protein [Streptomyces caniscabiei]MBD9728134.1 hypothetical protein [Streptomyces caniscabiei]MDX3513846.1 DUF6153 family protein [Streptomyces caniscabiei]MDX3722848.1 DUF6153 family protein [Streptomyces caniscabiei]WEO23622.1 DUF6153 family protein [Streptomyces caniscabiei]